MFLLPILAVNFACDSGQSSDGEEYLGYDYFPLEKGLYWIYDVTDIRHSIQGEHDTSTYYIREWIGDSTIDQEGKIAWFIYTFRRNNTSDPWDSEPVKIKTVKRSPTNLVVFEENIPYVKLTFPVKTGNIWDGNAFNTNEAQFYQYADNDSISAVGTEIMVVQENFDDGIVRRDIRYEIYASNIGMMYKETSTIEYCQEVSCLGEREILSGREIFQSLIEYGKD